MSDRDTVFAPHGQYDGVVAGNLVMAHVTGPFNRELITTLAGQVADFYRALPTDRKVGGVTVFHQSMLITADGIVAFRDLIAQELSLLPLGIVVAHVAGPDVEAVEFMTSVFAKSIYGPFGIPYRCFETVETAERWVREQLSP